MANVSSITASIVGEVGEQLVRALVPVQAQHLSRGRRVDQGQCALLAVDLVLGEPQRRRDLDPVDRGDLVADADRDVREAVVVGDRQVADQRLVDRVVDRALDPGGEHGHERDQRQPDHQRRGGRRRAARVADRVLVREPAGDAAAAARAARRPPSRQRRDQHRAQQRDPEEDGDRADADPGLAGAQGAEDPERHRRRAEQPEDRAGGGAATTFAGGRRDDAVAQPGDRRTRGWRAAPGPGPRPPRSPTPRTRPMMIVRGSITVPVEGRSMPSAANRPLITFAKPIPSATPDRGGAEADRRRLEDDRGEDLAPRGAQGAQHRELAGPLGDRDREGVEDQEGGDEQRHPGEDQQRGLDEAGELADVVALGLDVLLAGLDVEVGGAPPAARRRAGRARRRPRRRPRSGRTRPPCR